MRGSKSDLSLHKYDESTSKTRSLHDIPDFVNSYGHDNQPTTSTSSPPDTKPIITSRFEDGTRSSSDSNQSVEVTDLLKENKNKDDKTDQS